MDSTAGCGVGALAITELQATSRVAFEQLHSIVMTALSCSTVPTILCLDRGVSSVRGNYASLPQRFVCIARMHLNMTSAARRALPCVRRCDWPVV